MAGRNGLKIGIALGDREMVGVVMGKGRIPSARVPVSLGDGGPELGVELARSFGELKAALEDATGNPTDGASVFVSLLPPMADARMVSFPPMRKSEIEAVLERDAARHFLGANRPRVVSVRLPRGSAKDARKQGGTSQAVLVAAAPLGLLEAVRSALGKVGWRGDSFTAAHGAWLESGHFQKGTPPSAVVSVLGSTAHVFRMEGTDTAAVRQIPSSDSSAIAGAVGKGPGRAVVLAGPRVFEEIKSALASVGVTASRDPEGWSGAEEAAAARAATDVLGLVPPTLAGERRERERRNILAMVGMAAVLVIASLGAHLWGTHRELGAVQAQREAFRAEVAPLLSTRDSLSSLVTRIQSMEDLSRTSQVWTRSLVELTALLPESAYLTGFFASGDTVELEAAGAQAGEAIQTLREAGLFQEIRLQGLVERELEEGETVVERFKLWARLPNAGGEEGGS